MTNLAFARVLVARDCTRLMQALSMIPTTNYNVHQAYSSNAPHFILSSCPYRATSRITICAEKIA
ncbi:hypothetical protein MESS2_820018 [Mesorhizobium metallidurans STM 2683]|uniref:Uncharacterized protein n=1 Tax=Mesorhizobium metallidurans STM 2683 TaxID=1297569 RepID=M5EYG7_9HYPH|nr:hypothetical protein MESS2_820018 [Mesorhizobium metallidurans STM 2683]